MRIIDCFTFFNELEMLEFRLKELWDTVDFFVLVEGNRTFSNNVKPLYFEENKSRFSKYLKKIVHVMVNDLPDTDDSWEIEYFQRNCITRGLSSVAARPDDLVVISDVDEIPDSRVLKGISLDQFMKAELVFTQVFHYYDLTFIVSRGWKGSIAMRYDFFIREYKGSPQLVRDNRNTISNTEVAGWHFSYFGDVEFIRNKIKNFAHQELNTPDYLDKENIAQCLKEGVSIFSRKRKFELVPIAENDYLPNNYRMLISCGTE